MSLRIMGLKIFLTSLIVRGILRMGVQEANLVHFYLFSVITKLVSTPSIIFIGYTNFVHQGAPNSHRDDVRRAVRGVLR
jgi:hypothetical protein